MKYRITSTCHNSAESIFRDYPELMKMKNITVEDDYPYLTTDSLEDIEFIRKTTCGSIVIDSDYESYDGEQLMLEIYDSWRE